MTGSTSHAAIRRIAARLPFPNCNPMQGASSGRAPEAGECGKYLGRQTEDPCVAGRQILWMRTVAKFAMGGRRALSQAGGGILPLFGKWLVIRFWAVAVLAIQ